MSALSIAVAGLLLACGGEPAPRPVSTPVSRTGDGPVTVSIPSLTRPDGRAAVLGSELAASELPPLGLEALGERQASDALVAINTTVGPCPVCMQEGYSIARCMANGVEGCPNVPAVARRAVRLAAQGLDFLSLLPRIRYEEPWRALPGERLGPPGTLTVLTAVDYDDPFSRAALPAWQSLAQTYGDKLHWGVLQRPDLERHPLAERAALLVLAAGRQGRGEAAHLALLDRDSALDAAALDGLPVALGLDPERLRADLADPALREALDTDRALAAALDVRGTPTTFIGGYPVRGARELPFYSALIDDLLADAGDPWPAPE